MKHVCILAAVVAVFTASISCDKIDENNNPYKPLELSSTATKFVEKGGDFSVEFIDRINSATDEDYIISPLSMQFLLGMILNGAQGETLDEICKVLGYGAGEVEAVNEYVSSMLKQLPKMDRQTTLTIANAIFVDDGWPLKQTYVNAVEKNYNAKITNLNFIDGDRALKTINGWCSDNTNGMIPKVLDQVDPDMLAYLLNAMYFKSQWTGKFPKSNTAEEDFTCETGAKVKVKMMKQEKSQPYFENDIFQAVRMAYGNGVFNMTFLLPQKGHTVADITAALKKLGWNAVLRSMETRTVDLWIPRFETRFGMKLNDILSAMGMPRSFDASLAQFKAMSEYALYLDFVRQDAAIKVDEDGTEAAVVSSAGMKKEMEAAPLEPAVFHADHPFIYLITESSTGVILFAGRYSGK